MGLIGSEHHIRAKLSPTMKAAIIFCILIVFLNNLTSFGLEVKVILKKNFTNSICELFLSQTQFDVTLERWEFKQISDIQLLNLSKLVRTKTNKKYHFKGIVIFPELIDNDVEVRKRNQFARISNIE